MNIRGSHIIKACIVGLAGIFAYGTYVEYKAIRKEEEIRKGDFEDSNEEPEDFEPMSTTEAIKEAAKRAVKDAKDAILDDPTPFAEGCVIGALAGLCYIAGTNDGKIWTKAAAEAAVNDAYDDGMTLGFAGGRKWTRNHVKISNPENADQIISNLDIYEKLHAGSDSMKWRPSDFKNDPDVMSDYNYMKSHITEE